MTHLTIFEIGPIAHYAENSRKTRDLWGASFLFSWLIGHVAKAIEDRGGKITRPHLDEDPLYQYIKNDGKVKNPIVAGSIPDQIWCEHDDESLPTCVRNAFVAELERLYDGCLVALPGKPSYAKGADRSFAISQLKAYFRLFWVTGSPGEEERLERAIAHRGSLYNFTSGIDGANKANVKHDKCSLMADYQRVVTLEEARRGGRDEQLCAMAVIKRGLLEYLHQVGMVDVRKFQSTTAVAANVVTEIRYEVKERPKRGEDRLTLWKCWRELYKRLKSEIAVRGGKFDREDVWGYYFEDNPPAGELKKIFNRYAVDEEQKRWISHGFYAIVKLDGDSTGELHRLYPGDTKLSKAISTYSHGCADILHGKGQLIYAGGEDVLFIVHPLHLLKVVEEFDNLWLKQLGAFHYKDRRQPTISAGAYICHHKHPLKLALRGAEDAEQEAKKLPGKGQMVIRLILGSQEKGPFTMRIRRDQYSLSDFQLLMDRYKGEALPRGFVYKLEEQQTVMQHVLEPDDVEGYVRMLLSKTRGIPHTEGVKDDPLKTLIECSVTQNKDGELDYTDLLRRLYLARFLTGGE